MNLLEMRAPTRRAPARRVVLQQPVSARANRYTEAQVARAKAALAVGLSRSWIARNLNCSPEIIDKWGSGKAQAEVPLDREVYEVMCRAIEQENAAAALCEIALVRALHGEKP